MVAPLISISDQSRTAPRVTRSPSHPFYIYHRPFAIQPFFFAPVLPGETLKNLILQARVVSDPINNSVIGWWCEHYFFYVKLRDLYTRDLWVAMLLDPATDLSSMDAASEPLEHHLNGTANPAINYVHQCLTRVTDVFFRAEGENANDYLQGNLPSAALNMTDAMQSAIKDSDWITASGIDENLVSTSAGQGDATAAVYTSEIDAAMRRYQFASQNRLTDMTFAEFCRQYGVKLPDAEEDLKPELLRYSRDWSYPSNTIDPTSGTARSAMSWSIAERADKARLFKEPGFILGVTVVRPKMYLSNINGDATSAMRDVYRWLPAPLANDPFSSWVKEASGDPPLSGLAAAYWWDVKDLFLHGQQFLNFSTASEPHRCNLAVLPKAATHSGGKGVVYYPASTDVDKLFVTETAGVSKIRQDGIVTAHILGRQVETSPQSIGNNKTV